MGRRKWFTIFSDCDLILNDNSYHYDLWGMNGERGSRQETMDERRIDEIEINEHAANEKTGCARDCLLSCSCNGSLRKWRDK
jgi:hypothetical protein